MIIFIVYINSIYVKSTTPSQINTGSKKELTLESYWERSRAAIVLYSGSTERYWLALPNFLTPGCIWYLSGMYLAVPYCRSKWWFLRSGRFILNFWLYLNPWVYCTHHKLSRTGLRVADTIVEAKKPPSESHDNKNLRPLWRNRTSFNGKKIIRTYLKMLVWIAEALEQTQIDSLVKPRNGRAIILVVRVRGAQITVWIPYYSETVWYPT